jgi:hypothetical protein
VPENADRILGVIVIVLAFALMWYAMGFLFTLFLSLWLISVRLLLLYLLGKDSRLAKTAAVLLMPNAIFLFFLPRRIKDQMQELKSREKRKA